MLSDQALLARCYFRASRIADNSSWRDVALDTLAFVERARTPAGLCRVTRRRRRWNGRIPCHLDARRGARRPQRIPRGDVRDVLARWRIDLKGTFEGRSIPRLREGAAFLTPPELGAAHETADWRARRTRATGPRREDSFSNERHARSAFLASGTGELETRDSISCAHCVALTSTMRQWWRNRASSAAHATANDLAWLIDAAIDAFELHGGGRVARDRSWGPRHISSSISGTARWPTEIDPHVGAGFFTQSDLVGDLSTRPKEIFDGATPRRTRSARGRARAPGPCATRPPHCSSSPSDWSNSPVRSLSLIPVPSWISLTERATRWKVLSCHSGDANELSDHVRSRAMFPHCFSYWHGSLRTPREPRRGVRLRLSRRCL